MLLAAAAVVDGRMYAIRDESPPPRPTTRTVAGNCRMKYIGKIDARTDADGRDLHLSAFFFSFLRLSRLCCITRVQQHQQQQYVSRYNALSVGFFRVFHS